MPPRGAPVQRTAGRRQRRATSTRKDAPRSPSVASSSSQASSSASSSDCEEDCDRDSDSERESDSEPSSVPDRREQAEEEAAGDRIPLFDGLAANDISATVLTEMRLCTDCAERISGCHRY